MKKYILATLLTATFIIPATLFARDDIRVRRPITVIKRIGIKPNKLPKELAPIKAKLVTQHNRVTGLLPKTTLTRVEKSYRKSALKIFHADRFSLTETRNIIRANGRFTSPDIYALVMIVLSELSQDLEDDLKEFLDQMAELNRVKKSMRDQINKMRQAKQDAVNALRNRKAISLMNQLDLNYMEDYTENLEIDYYVAPELRVVHELDRVCFQGIKHVCSPTLLRDLLDKLKGKLDGMNELSEMTSLRLQMTMDRRSKFISTLSQIMKKISTTQDTLIHNIK
jgi:hypothetical protein